MPNILFSRGRLERGYGKVLRAAQTRTRPTIYEKIMKNIFTLFLLLVIDAKPKNTAKERVREFVRDAIESNDVVAFTKSYCPYSHRARKALASADIEFKYYDINRMPGNKKIKLEKI